LTLIQPHTSEGTGESSDLQTETRLCRRQIFKFDIQKIRNRLDGHISLAAHRRRQGIQFAE
jgi:hypothetical protein